MSKNIVKGNIGNALHDVSPDHIVATADEIFDEQRQQYQETINERVGDYEENPEFVEVSVDSSNHVLYGVQNDGNFYFGAGVPNQVKDELDLLSQKIDVDVSTAIGELREEIDGSINTRIQELEDITDEKFANIDSSLNDLGFYEDNPEFLRVNLDSSNRVLYGIQKDGNFYFGCGVPNQIQSELDVINNKIDNDIENAIERVDASINDLREEIDSSISERFNRVDASLYELGYYEENPEYVKAIIDSSHKLLYGVKTDGDFYFGAGVPSQVKDYVEAGNAKQDASINKIERRYLNLNEYDGSIGKNYTLEEAIAAVPEEYRNGGLILTFNSNESNDLYMLDSSVWDTDPYSWSIVQKSKCIDNSEYIEIKLDSVDHILESRNKDGVKKEYVGFETPYVITNNISTQKYDIDGNLIYTIDNPEYIRVTLDASNHILNGITKDGDTIISGVSILDLKRRIDNNVIEVGYDESTYSIYTITGTESNVNLSMDSSGNIYQETIE